MSAKRKAALVHVPAIDDDPTERKRLLNILAQRRYRRRKKEHLQHLERDAGRDSSAESSPGHQPHTPSPVNAAVSLQLSGLIDFDQPPYVDCNFDAGCFTSEADATISESLDLNCLDPKTLQTFDASYFHPLPSLPASPASDQSTVLSSHDQSLSLTSSSAQSGCGQNLGSDEAHLPMLELNLLRGCMSIAQRMGIDSLIWSLDANSIFQGSAVQDYFHLPVNLWPTTMQRRIPHHPVFDVLPWPSVRDKFILVLSQPREVRPPSARSPTALIDFVYDLEDSAEGVRIWGDDPCAAEHWEIGEKVFSNWWWALSREVVNQSNEMRFNRGATLLGIDYQP